MQFGHGSSANDGRRFVSTSQPRIGLDPASYPLAVPLFQASITASRSVIGRRPKDIAELMNELVVAGAKRDEIL